VQASPVAKAGRAAARTAVPAAKASLATMADDPADLERIRDQVGNVLSGFLGLQGTVLAEIDAEMLPWLDAMRDLLAGGKRLRPAFCYWGWRAAGGADCREIFAAAAALELLHGSALVHDDVMDGSETRRGRPAVHRQFAARHAAGGHRGSAEGFGTGAAILIGDLLLAWTGQLYHGGGLDPAALRRGQPVLDAMQTEVMCGQYLDLIGQAAGDGTVSSALHVMTYKSAKYTIERPLQLGAALAGPGRAGRAADPAGQQADEPVMRALSGYGIPLGIAFQIRDDVLGVFGDPLRTGKPVTGDLREGKRTVLVAIARERATAAQASVLDRLLGDPLLTEAGATEIRTVLADTGAVAECEKLIDQNISAALSALAAAPVAPEARKALTELASIVTERHS
jgi:geranylgeranyl diphosphate synthase, type I